MSYFYPKHPLQPSDELVFQVPSISLTHDQCMILQDTFQVLPPSNHTDLAINLQDKSQIIEPTFNTDLNDNINHHDGSQRSSSKNKKIIHRDVERLRRQEMNALYASLRSLLPLEYLKGKRSISDHMNQAVHYVKHMEKKIEELGDKRDELKRLSDSYKLGGNLCSSGSVRVLPCWPGVEIIIRSNCEDGVLPLSRVMRVLAEEGFALISCVSTKVKGSLIYTIQSEAMNDPASKDMALLEHKLVDLLKLDSGVSF